MRTKSKITAYGKNGTAFQPLRTKLIDSDVEVKSVKKKEKKTHHNRPRW